MKARGRHERVARSVAVLVACVWAAQTAEARQAPTQAPRPQPVAIGIDERLGGPPVLGPALDTVGTLPEFPIAVRILVDRAELEPVAGQINLDSVLARVEAYSSRKIHVWLSLSGAPVNGDAAPGWRRLVRALADRLRGRVEGYEIRDPGGLLARDPLTAGFLIKLAAVELNAADPAATVAIGIDDTTTAEILDRLYEEGVGPYIAAVSLSRPASFSGNDWNARLTSLKQLIDRRDPGSRLIETGISLGTGPSAAARFLDDQLRRLGGDVGLTTFDGDSSAVVALIRAGARIKDLLTAEIVPLDERASNLTLVASGANVLTRVPHRLLFNVSNFSTYLLYWSSRSIEDIQASLTLTTDGTPMLRDPIGDTVRPVANVGRDQTTRVTRVPLPPTDRPVFVDYNYGAEDIFTLREDTQERATLTVGEIIARHQQVLAAQDARLENYVATMQMAQHFRASASDSFDVVSENRFFSDREGVEWEELSFSINGTKWGRDRPAFPMLQPEKVLSLPLDLRLGADYTYRLDGTESVNGVDCYVVRFDPVGASRSLYRGTVWIDTTRFERVKLQTVQTQLAAPVVSNEEIQTFEPITDPDGRRMMLFTHLTSRQIILIAGRNLLLEKEVNFSDFSVNDPMFAERRLSARNSERIMYRDTDQGLRNYVKEGEQRVVSNRMTSSAKAMAMGVTIDPSFDFPLPIFGVNYLDFDFLGSKDSQLALLFGGVLALGNIQRPKLMGPLDASVDFFAIAVPGNDRVYEGEQEREGERVLNWPLSVGANLGYQFTSFQKLSGSYQMKFDGFVADAATAADFVVPETTFTHGLGLAYEFKRAGYNLSLQGTRFVRGSWKPWGPADALVDSSRTYDKYSVSLSKDFFYNVFHKFHFNGAYFGGDELDRFSMYQFGLFDETKVHGVPAAGIRFNELAMVRGSYSFNIFEQYRFDLFLDRAYGRDERLTAWQPLTGTGVAVNLRAPWSTIFRAEVGKSFLPPAHRGMGSTVVQILVLKPL